MRMRNWLLSLYLICSCACSVSQSGTGAAAQPLLTSATVVAPTSGFGSPTTTTTIDANGNVNWVGGAWYVPLPVAAGDVIGTVTVVVRDNGPNNGHSLDGNNVLANLISRTAAGDTSRAFASSNGSGSQQTLTLAPSGGYTVQVGDEMLLELHGLTGGAVPGPSTVPSMTGSVVAAPMMPERATTTLTHNIAFAQPGTFAGSNSVITILGGNSVVLMFGTATISDDYLPMSVPVGKTIVGWRVWLHKETSSGTVVARLRDNDMASSFTANTVGSAQSNSDSSPGFITLGQTGLSVPVTLGHSYYIAARSGGQTGGHDYVFGYAVMIAD